MNRRALFVLYICLTKLTSIHIKQASAKHWISINHSVSSRSQSPLDSLLSMALPGYCIYFYCSIFHEKIIGLIFSIFAGNSLMAGQKKPRWDEVEDWVEPKKTLGFFKTGKWGFLFKIP